MTLNQSQAEAVYSAMCALNNVGGRVFAAMGDRRVTEAKSCITVFERLEGQWEPRERYASQQEFAAAYGLNSDAAPDAPGAVVNPLDNTSLRHERVNSAAGRAIAERLNP